MGKKSNAVKEYLPGEPAVLGAGKSKKRHSVEQPVEPNEEVAPSEPAVLGGISKKKVIGEQPVESDDSGDQHDADNGVEVKPKRKRKRKNKSGNFSAEIGGDLEGAGRADPPAAPGTVYVEGISYDASETDLTAFFGSCGRISSIRMPRYHDSGRPRGYAHVEFSNEASVEAALNLSGKFMMGRYLSVARANEPKLNQAAAEAAASNAAVKRPRNGCVTVFVKNLPYDATEELLRAEFGDCGRIVSVRLPLWNHTKMAKGFGYIEFEHATSADSAVKKSGARIGGRMILVDYDTASGPKSSFRLPSGEFWHKVDASQGGGLGKKKNKELDAGELRFDRQSRDKGMIGGRGKPKMKAKLENNNLKRREFDSFGGQSLRGSRGVRHSDA